MRLGRKKALLIFSRGLLIAAVFLLGSASGPFYYRLREKPSNSPLAQPVEKDKYLNFLFEVYDIIKDNYWEKITDGELSSIFTLGIEKLTGQPPALKTKDKTGLLNLITTTLGQVESEEKKKEFSTKLADIVLANLKPFGRSRLYTKRREASLKNTIANVDPEVNLYNVLGVGKEASPAAIKEAYEEKIEKLKIEAEKSEEARKELERIERAYKVLSDLDNRKVYDASGVEPTMDYRLVRPDILHLHIKKISPTTLDELKRVTEKVDNQEKLDTLILDLRDNIGGSIDLLPYLLGPFIGQDQYAFQFFHQEERTDFKTKTGWLPSLVRYKKVVILINEGTQSSAELVAATLKKYNVGVLIGTPTRGWGTVERVFPLDKQIDPREKHSIFLVHSLVLREDGQPIEGKGVEPLINIDDSNWEEQLFSHFHYEGLAEAIKEIL